jgi:cytochrome P450
LVQAGSPNESKSPAISPAAVLGNIFIFILAGHETSANTLTYAVTLLACRPDVQKALQANLDDIFGTRPTTQWSFEEDFPKVLGGHVGALMNETLRLYSVLPFLPKKTGTLPKALTINDANYTIPANTLIMINTSATHRNPKYWPAAARSDAADGPPYPVSSFDPARWLQNQGTNPTLFSPKPGSYIPFAEGPRACMGKRFAQAQFCAVISSIFKEYSVELTFTDDLQRAGETSDQSLWEKARCNAEQKLSTGVGFLTSLKMKKAVPLRLVKRGEK